MRFESLSSAVRLPCAVAMLALSLSLAGCAATKHSGDYRAQAGGPGQRVALATPPAGGRPQPVIEDDGLPTQAAPRLRRNPEPDNPDEPFSPNYGPPPVGAAPKRPLPPAHTPSVPPTAPVRKAAMTEDEANAIIARAIAEHEVRGQ